MHNKEHWENVYTTKATDTVSWFQEHAETSLKLIQSIHAEKNASIIDVGGGASTLVDDLLSSGYSNISVLDLSGAALEAAKKRLGISAEKVTWIETDITNASLPEYQFDLWHDRAVFHFLTQAEDRKAYVNAVSASVKLGGHIIISTFAEDGPTQCSGLPVVRYSAESLHTEFGKHFLLQQHFYESHNTPFGTVQKFVYCHLIKNI